MTRPAPERTFPPEVATPAEVAAIIAQCSLRAPTGIRNRALLVLLYRSGLRIGEALALRPADLDLRHHRVRVLHGKGSRTTGKGSASGGRSGKATMRSVHPDASDALARWLDRRRALGIRGGPLFCTLEGGKLSAGYVRDALARYARRAGVTRRVTPHTLRHTYAAELEAAGVSPLRISKALGHSSIAVTHRYMDHLTNGDAIEALAAVELPPLELPARP